MKKLISILLVLAMLPVLSCCAGKGGDASSPEGSISAESSAPSEGDSPQEESAAPFGVGYYKEYGINPYTCTNAQNQTLTGLVYEPLFELTDQFEARPCLAESISVKVQKHGGEESEPEEDTPEGEDEEASSEEEPSTETAAVSYTTRVTVKLRKGVKFSDGSGLHADDVVYSMERAAESGSVYHSRFTHIFDIHAPDKDTVTFSMNVGQADAAALLTFPIVKYGTGTEKFPVGTGPYQPVMKKNAFRWLKANSGWWRRNTEDIIEIDPGQEEEAPAVESISILQPVERIRVYTYENPSDLIFGFTSSAVSVVQTDFTAPEALPYIGDYTVTDYPTTNLMYLGCNTVKNRLCGSQKLRSAIYRGINRTMVAERMMAHHALGTALPVSPQSPWYSQELEEALGYDPEAASELCRAASNSGTFQLIVNKESSFKTALAQEIAAELREIGISVRVEKLPWKEFKTALKEGEYDLYLGEVVLDGTFDLSRLILKGGSLNYCKFSSDKLTNAMRAFQAASEKKKPEAAKEYFTQLAKSAPVIPLCFKNGSALTMRGGLTGLRSTQQNLYASLWRWKVPAGMVKASAE